MKEKTISAPVFFKGTGLHTGMKTEMTVCPAPERSGIRFQRTDLPGCPFLEAVADNVVQTERSTVLLKDRVRVHTSEHLMAAFYGLDIHNALVQLNGPEVPILDGSAYPFARAFTDIGIQEQHACVRYGHLSSALQFSDPDTGTLIEINPRSWAGRNMFIPRERTLRRKSLPAELLYFCTKFCSFIKTGWSGAVT